MKDNIIVVVVHPARRGASVRVGQPLIAQHGITLPDVGTPIHRIMVPDACHDVMCRAGQLLEDSVPSLKREH